MGQIAKRGFDVAAIVAAAPLLLPLTLGVAAQVRWNIGRPVLFRQHRPGLNGELFDILKFRTMTDQRDASSRYTRDGASNLCDWLILFGVFVVHATTSLIRRIVWGDKVA